MTYTASMPAQPLRFGELKKKGFGLWRDEEASKYIQRHGTTAYTAKQMRAAREARIKTMKANAGGDPVFVSPAGKKYKITGAPGEHYLLLSDPYLNLSGQIERAHAARRPFTINPATMATWFTTVDLLVANGKRIQWDFKSPPKIFDVEDPENTLDMKKGEVVRLDQVKVRWNADKATLEVKSPASEMALKASFPESGLAHLSKKSVFRPAGKNVPQEIHGLIGQTFKPGWDGDRPQTLIERMKNLFQRVDPHGRGVIEVMNSDGTVRRSTKADSPEAVLAGYKLDPDIWPPEAEFSKLRPEEKTFYALA